MEIEIENYRGFEIRFNTERETFVCDIDDERSVKKSFSAIKKFIDDYKKENSDFIPFKVSNIPARLWGDGEGTVIGLRKDGKFILKNAKGNFKIISSYDEKDVMLNLEENSLFVSQLLELNEEIENYRKIHAKRKEDIMSNMKIITLADYRNTLNN